MLGEQLPLPNHLIPSISVLHYENHFHKHDKSGSCMCKSPMLAIGKDRARG